MHSASSNLVFCDKVCIVRMMTNTDNVESSLLLFIKNLFCYKLHICRASSRVVSSMMCAVQVVRHTEHIALYRTIVYCHVTGNIMGCSLTVTGAGVAG